MKRVLFYLLALAFMAGCAEGGVVNVSENSVTFPAEGGEKIVQITSDAVWSYSYEADWIYVRHQAGVIRIIADPSNEPGTRYATVSLTVEDNVEAEVQVTQEGVELYVPQGTVEARNSGETVYLSVFSNLEWDIDNPLDWVEAEKFGSSLRLEVQPNRNPQARSGVITLSHGALSQNIVLSQDGSEWYETFDMVKVKGGSFLMGAQKTDSSGSNYDTSAFQIEAPVHKVTVSDFYISRYEVTQAQWVAAMGSNPSSVQGDNLPVESVSWNDVIKFIGVLNKASGLEYRLPTEAEWEYAARGGANSEGYKYSGSPILGACGWYYSNSAAAMREGGGKEPNELGLYDMSGNVREWCSDWFGEYPSKEEKDPQGPSSGSVKVNRGGSWASPAVNCRNSYRFTDYPSESANDLGFRLVLTK